MSEISNNSQQKKELLKHLLLELHNGTAPDLIRNRLVELLKNIPYDDVVDVEQELINEGLPEEEILAFCDIHTLVLEGHIDQSGAQAIPLGHPVDTLKHENRELEKVCDAILHLIDDIDALQDADMPAHFMKLHARFNELMDVDKHYLKKEYLLFPYLEKYEITGPRKVMWAKHDDTRKKIKDAIAVVSTPGALTVDEAKMVATMILYPAVMSVPEMIMKEEEILLPMSMDRLTDEDWYQIYQQTMEFGYCLYDPQHEWKPEGILSSDVMYNSKNAMQLSTGSFNVDEIESLFRTLPIDLTFVDKDDKVKFFSLGPDRIFTRNRAIIGRDVRMCHPPSSVHVVEQILEDFKSGKESTAAFWINMQGKFIYIEYFAMRGKEGDYLGTIEFTQDLTHLRKLEGEQRLLSYSKK